MTDNRDIVVLVADDEPSMLALVSAYLKSKGYKVIEASDGDRAWQLAHEHLPDLVILDVMMPAMSGWEVCRKIREALPLAHTGVIMLTGIGENLNEMTSPLYGADAHIDKPFEFADLEQRMKETLAKRKSEHTMGRPDGADEETEPAQDDETEESMPPSEQEDEVDAGVVSEYPASSKHAPKAAARKPRKQAPKPKQTAAPVAAAKPSKKASKKKVARKAKKKTAAKAAKKPSSRRTKSAVRSKAPKVGKKAKKGPSNKKGSSKKASGKKASKKATRGKKPVAAKKARGRGRASSKTVGKRGKVQRRKKSKRG